MSQFYLMLHEIHRDRQFASNPEIKWNPCLELLCFRFPLYSFLLRSTTQEKIGGQ